jgi:hypothetical protein
MEALERAGVNMNDLKVIRSVIDRCGEIQSRLQTDLLAPAGW